MADGIVKRKEYLVKRISPSETYEELLRFPRYLEIETVNACNARCPMCTVSNWQRKYKPMTDELFSKIANEVTKHAREVKRVTLYRDGEPLLDNKLPDRISVLKRGGIKATSISTNVSLLTESKGKELLEAGIDIVILSIDSLVKDVYENIRVGLNFETVLENTLRFIDLRNKIRPETKIWMRMIRQEGNFNEWPDYRKYWSRFLSRGDRIYYHNIFNWGGQLKDFRPITKSYEPNLPCVALWSLLVIFTNGDVPLCNADYKNSYPTGNVTSNSIKELWESQIIRKRRKLHLSGKKGTINLCKNCNVWDESPDRGNISCQFAAETDIVHEVEKL